MSLKTLLKEKLAYQQPSPLDSLQSDFNLAKGAELYNIYCAICHGKKGNGKGTLAKNEKILGVPSYDARDITVGSTLPYHVLWAKLNGVLCLSICFSRRDVAGC